MRRRVEGREREWRREDQSKHANGKIACCFVYCMLMGEIRGTGWHRLGGGRVEQDETGQDEMEERRGSKQEEGERNGGD